MGKRKYDRKIGGAKKVGISLGSPEENLILAVIKQAWCDAFRGELQTVYEEKKMIRDRETSKRMFEAEETNAWRQSLSYLADAIQIDVYKLVEGYNKFKAYRLKGHKYPKPALAFDTLSKILITERIRND